MSEQPVIGQNQGSSGGGGAPSGAAGGDLAGTYPNPTIKSAVGLTGNATAVTQSAGDNSTRIATTAYADAIAANSYPRLLPTGWSSQTFSRDEVGTNSASTGTTGVCVAQVLYLRAGTVVSNLNVMIGATVAATATHFWQALADINRVMVACTADDTSASSGTVANTLRTQAIATIASGASSTYTVPTSGWYYLIVNSTAGTVPTFIQASINSGVIPGLAPIICGTSETISTGPPAFAKTFGALTATAKIMYGGTS